MSQTLADDDVVATLADAEGATREPLLVLEPLLAFLDAHGIGEGPTLDIAPIGDGHSNHTFLIDRGGTTFVLRRPPRGELPPSAHDVLREARVIAAVGPAGVRAPQVLAVGDDLEILGGKAFYLMDAVPGEVITETVPPALDTPEQRRALSLDLVDALVELHAVDWEAAGLVGFGKPTGYLERQLRRFTGLWEHNRTREIPQVERVGTWLREHLPESGPASIVHGDFRLGNVIYAPGTPTVAAILDWEMATIGDPLADVGYLCMMWTQDGDPRGQFDLNKITRQEGFPTRAEIVARYEEQSGRTMQDIRWYTTLALWKSIVFMEGNYKRASSGLSDDPFLASFGEGVVELAGRAEELAHGG